MPGAFIKIKCSDCGNTQIIFDRSTTEIKCLVCGSLMATPAGGKAKLAAEVVEEVA